MKQVGVPLLPTSVRWLIVGAIASVIFAFSILMSPAQPPEPAPFWDKQLHFAAYAGLAIGLAYATAMSRLGSYRRIFMILGIAIAYGIAIEILQAPLPNRYFEYGDMAANALGALLGTAYLAIETRVRYVSVGLGVD